MNVIRYVLVVLAFGATVGCSEWNRLNKTEKGAVAGGALGAGTGAIIGSQVGAGGAGVAIGGAVGAAAGGLVGNALDETDTRQASIEERQRQQEATVRAQRREIDELRRQEGR